MYAKIRTTDAKGKKLKHFHHITMDSEFKGDLTVWKIFLNNSDLLVLCHPFLDWHGKFEMSEELCFYTDASKAVAKGFGCVYNNRFTWGRWEENYITKFDPSIEYLELYALCIGIATWDRLLKNKRITIFCDNQAVVEMVNNTTSSCKNCMFLIRQLVLGNILSNRRVFVKYIRSCDNSRSDTLSRMNFNLYFRLSPNSRKEPDALPEVL